MKGFNNYEKFPFTSIADCDNEVFSSAKDITNHISSIANGKKTIIVVDCYPNTNYDDITSIFADLDIEMICTDKCAISKQEYRASIQNHLTDDRVFGVICHNLIDNYFNKTALDEMNSYAQNSNQSVLLYGVGASLVTSGDICIYADISRWEIQLRYRKGASNWNTDNSDAPILEKYKQGFFVEWRFADKHKQNVWKYMDFVLDTNIPSQPKMITANAFFKGLDTLSQEPFRLVPYFDPGVWGGQWMKEVCDLDKDKENFAWSFDGVPEENSVHLKYGDTTVELPAINLVLYAPEKLLGNRVYGRYGAEFPIRFDFLDTMGGQNLSLQVHPITQYIQQKFNMNYTQDESYYILDSDESTETFVYLGLKENIDREQMIADLKTAQNGGVDFDADKYVNKIPAKKHDHFLIPAGTVHCSGKDTMILEISATPYIFTFKLWDWGRLGLDGLPRPIHIEHGQNVINWERDTKYTYDNLVNQFEELSSTDDCIVTKTGLHECEPITTITYKSSKKVLHTGNGSVNMLNLVSGESAIIESPTNKFAPFIVHYAETFIIPASVQEYTISPYANATEIITLKAFIK